MDWPIRALHVKSILFETLANMEMMEGVVSKCLRIRVRLCTEVKTVQFLIVIL